MEKEDFADVKQGDKIVLMRWGVFEVTSKPESPSEGALTLTFLPNDSDFKSPKKITWLPSDSGLLSDVVVVEYDHLLNCKKPDEEGIDFTSVVNKNSKFETPFFSERLLSSFAPTTLLQFERRGYFIVDKKTSDA